MPAIVDVRITGEINEIYYLEIHRSVLCSYPFDAVYDVLNQDELWFTRCNVRNVVGTMEDSRLPSIVFEESNYIIHQLIEQILDC